MILALYSLALVLALLAIGAMTGGYYLTGALVLVLAALAALGALVLEKREER